MTKGIRGSLPTYVCSGFTFPPTLGQARPRAQAGPNWGRARPSLDKGGKGKPSDVFSLGLHQAGPSPDRTELGPGPAQPGPARSGPDRFGAGPGQAGPSWAEAGPGRTRSFAPRSCLQAQPSLARPDPVWPSLARPSPAQPSPGSARRAAGPARPELRCQ